MRIDFRQAWLPLLTLVALTVNGCSGGSGIASLGKGKESSESESRKRISASNKLVSDVTGIFKEHCESCHKPGEKGGNLTSIMDLESLIDQEFVVPGSKKSPLLKQMKSGKMPPSGAIDKAKIDLVEKWIVQGAVISLGDEDVKREFVREADLYRIAAEDLLGAVDEDEREFMRYFSSVHLYNSGASAELLATSAAGVNKLVNSLSSASSIKPATIVNAEMGIYRIDLRDYKWSAETWEKLVRIYPYLMVPQDTKGIGILQKDTKTNVPMIRTDWFLATAARAPTYYEILEFPGTLAEFEGMFGANTAQDVKSGKSKRAGFDNSAVSKENRIIERIEGSYGAYWRSYEFGTSLNDQGIFQRPLGPVAAGFPSSQSFREDGGEFIVTMKNGMLGFFIAGSNKKRLSKVPTDPDEDEIIAGFSCMACHQKGYIHRVDMVTEKVMENGSLSNILGDVEKLYVPSAELMELVDADSAAYREALKKAGVDFKKGDPVNRVAKGYELTMSLAQAAAEAGVTEDELVSALENRGELSDLADRVEDGSINRSDFNEFFKVLTEVLKDRI